MSHVFVTMPSCNVIHCTFSIYSTHLIPSCLCCSTEAIMAIEKWWLYLQGGKKIIAFVSVPSFLTVLGVSRVQFFEFLSATMTTESLCQMKARKKLKTLHCQKNKVKSTIRIRLKHHRLEPPRETRALQDTKAEQPPPPWVKALSQHQIKGNATKSSYCNLK